ncbi:MAG TPA: hypothetical protein VLT59_14610 [Steroidobacteraceae bacterium]|nr:hypothetical protein [Steroidobacteraceae bacterium]
MPLVACIKSGFAIAVSTALVACGSKTPDSSSQDASEPASTESAAAVIPASLAPFGDGYPAAGDPCRRLGESAATANWLDDSAILVGCPDAEAAAALGGRIVDTVQGVTLVSISTGDSNVGLAEMEGADTAESEDSLVPGTDYHATAQVACGFEGGDPTSNCPAGVKRNWGEDGTTLVEITKPDGSKRALFFRGTTPYGADSAEADGSAGWDFEVSRSGDESVVKFGPETYVIVDAFVVGG